MIELLYAQQKQMYEEGSKRVDGRIVSLHQPWVRPIVRGKAKAGVEFGSKIAVSLVNGYLVSASGAESTDNVGLIAYNVV